MSSARAAGPERDRPADPERVESPDAVDIPIAPAERRALEGIALIDRESELRGGSWHVRLALGVGLDGMPVVTNATMVDLDGAIVSTSRGVLLYGVGLGGRLEVHPYLDDVVAVGLLLDGALGGFGIDGGPALIATGRVGAEALLGYRWLFARGELAYGGRVGGALTRLDFQAPAAAGALGEHAFVRAGGGLRACWALGEAHGCVAGIDLTIAAEIPDVSGETYRSAAPFVVASASAFWTDVGVLSAELAWDAPVAGRAIAEPLAAAAPGWLFAVRVARALEWFGAPYRDPQVACDEDGSLTGVWRSPSGRRVLIEEREGAELVARTSTAEGRGVVEGRGRDARVRIEWREDGRRTVETLTVGSRTTLFQGDGVALERRCE